MTRTLLFLGGSNVTHPGQGRSTARLLEEELQELQPGAWEVQAAPVSMGRRMAADTEGLVREHSPDVVLLGLSAQPALYESVLIKVRRRWPAAARTAASIEAFLSRLAGKRPDAGESDRGRIYEVVQRVALAIIGGETRMTVEQSLQNTRACLAALAALESVPVLVRLPVGGARATPARRRRYEDRLQQLRAGVVEACFAYRIPFADVAEGLQETGRIPGHGHDVVHLDLETRRFEAGLLARKVLDIAGPRQAAGAPPAVQSG